MNRQLSVNLDNLLLSLSEVVDLANPTIAQHQQRTAFIAFEIAKQASLPPAITEDIFAAALLHDIGAITVEEKIAIHNFEVRNINVHTIRGQVLLEQIPWFKKLSKIVRNHHRRWDDWDQGIEDPLVLSSQIVLLADYVERLVDRNKYILHQSQSIMDKIEKLADTVLNRQVIAYFLEVTRREEFWLDLASPRLYSLLLNNGPFSAVKIGIDEVLLLSNMFRDLIDFKSRFTATHTTGVSECAVMLAQLFGLAEYDVKLMRIAGNFHDIGKLVIPNSILEKPDKLTAEEIQIMRCHTYYTYYTLNSIGGLQKIAEWAAYHHEKLDGSGYPFHCTSEDIGTGSRIMAVADIFTAISEDRPYRKGMSDDEIHRILQSQADRNLLDKRIVALLFENYDSISRKVKEKQGEAHEFYEKRFISITDEIENKGSGLQ